MSGGLLILTTSDCLVIEYVWRSLTQTAYTALTSLHSWTVTVAVSHLGPVEPIDITMRDWQVAMTDKGWKKVQGYWCWSHELIRHHIYSRVLHLPHLIFQKRDFIMKRSLDSFWSLCTQYTQWPLFAVECHTCLITNWKSKFFGQERNQLPLLLQVFYRTVRYSGVLHLLHINIRALSLHQYIFHCCHKKLV